MSKKHYTDIKVTYLPEQEAEIVGEIQAERMTELRAKAIESFKKELELPGFRKGNAPEHLVIQKVGELALLEEAARVALEEEYPNIIDEHKIDVIGRPEIQITKIAPNNPLGFKIKTSLYPKIQLADYAKIAKAEQKKTTKALEVTETEVDDVIQNIRKNVAHAEMHKEAHKKHGHGEHDHNHPEITEADLPPLDDAFLHMVGDFASVDELKEKIKENLLKEKELKEKDKKRVELMEAIIEKSEIELPKILIEGELEKMLAQFKDDLAHSGVKYEDYLVHIKKSEEDIKGEWKETAVKRAKSQIILNEIAKKEDLRPNEDEVKKQMDNILAHHKDADRFRVRMYVETFLQNDMVFAFLEK